ncbi:flavin reductase (DIM6/NTAB) family NADH-FMN oxidoreductase RutF [Catenulispora sp. MAP12-49]|uniref:flavin reductase family protein n=1 Tax=Catenulispora sp. MAP12-49 TaxID=3156302 RepID=UPI0035192023
MTTASAAHSPRGAVGGGAGVGRAGDAAGGLGAVGGGAGAAGAASLSREAAAGTISAADGFAADREAVRSGLRWHAKGVAVITAGVHQPVGFAATSLATVSFEPPVLSFAVRKRSASWPVLAAEDRVMVHLLADDQADLARLFGVSGGAKFAEGIRWSRGAEGLPVLDGALAWIMLTVVRRLHFDGHAIVLGRITAVRASAGRRPLIHHDGAYGALA